MPVTKKDPYMQIKLKYFSRKRERLIKGKKEMPQIEVDGEIMEQCANCGNIWDGYAQCNCWQWMDAVAYESDESGYESN